MHAEQAGDTRALVDHAPVAAEEAIRLGSYSQAIDDLELLLAQAATLPDRTVALACSQLSYALYTVNRFADSAAHGWRGVAAAEAAGDATVVADALLRLTRTLYWSDGPRAAAQAIERALPQLEALGDDARLATAHAEVARVHSDLVAVGPVAEPDPEGDPHGDRRAGLEGHRAAEVGGEHGRVGAGDTDRADLERVGRGPVLQGHVERGRLADGRGWEAQRGRRGDEATRGRAPGSAVTAVPDSGTPRSPLPEWFTRRVADRDPAAVGENTTVMVVDWPGASATEVASSKPSANMPASGPAMPVDSIVRAPDSAAFLIVTSCVACWPTTVWGNTNDDGVACGDPLAPLEHATSPDATAPGTSTAARSFQSVGQFRTPHLPAGVRGRASWPTPSPVTAATGRPQLAVRGACQPRVGDKCTSDGGVRAVGAVE